MDKVVVLNKYYINYYNYTDSLLTAYFKITQFSFCFTLYDNLYTCIFKHKSKKTID